MTEIVRALGGSVVAIGCLVDKSGGEVPAEARSSAAAFPRGALSA